MIGTKSVHVVVIDENGAVFLAASKVVFLLTPGALHGRFATPTKVTLVSLKTFHDSLQLVHFEPSQTPTQIGRLSDPLTVKRSCIEGAGSLQNYHKTPNLNKTQK